MSYISVHDKSLRATLISNFLVAELLAAQSVVDYQLLLISPWITNFALSVPAGGDLAPLINSSGARPQLFDVLKQIAKWERQVRIVVRPETSQRRAELFLEPLRPLARLAAISICQNPELHAKLYVGRCGALYGSLNLTQSGVTRNIEFTTYASDLRTIARLRAEAQRIFETAEELRL